MTTTPNLGLELPAGMEQLSVYRAALAAALSALDDGAVLTVNGTPPDSSGNVNVSVGTSAVTSVNTRTGDVIGLAEQITLTTEVTRATAQENLKMAKLANGTDIADPVAFRDALGLGNAATKAVGTSSTEVAVGNDSRFASAAQKSQNGADFADTAATLANLGGAKLIEGQQTISGGTSFTFGDVTAGTMKIVNLSTASTTATLPTPAAGKSFLAVYVQDSSGNRQVTHSVSPSVRFPGGTGLGLSTAANAIDLVSYVCWDGTQWECLSGSVAIDPAKLFPDRYFASGGTAAMPLGSATSNAVTTGSGVLKLMYITALRTETVNSMKLRIGGSAYTTPTLLRFGIYTVNPSTGDLALVASTVNDTTSATSTATNIVRALASAYTLNYGSRYALAYLGVAGSAADLVGAILADAGDSSESGTRIAGNMTGQTDLPSTIAGGSVANTAGLIQIKAAA